MKTQTFQNPLRALRLTAAGGLVCVVLYAFLLTPRVADAESCRTIGGCVGNVWLIHVPRGQFTASVLLQTSGLPAAGRVEVLRQNAALLPPDLFSGSYLPQLTDALAKQQSGQTILSGFGNELEKGMKVKVLSYQTFPSLGRMAGELFVVVLVLSE